MSNSYYEGFAQAIIEQAAHDKRAQPWKCSVKPGPANPDAKEEWYEVTGEQGNKQCGEGVDVRKHVFPIEEVEVCTNAFPMGEGSVLTNSFPMGELSVRTNVFPI